MHQTKIKFGIQHDATFHTPLEFYLLEHYYISKENSHSSTIGKREKENGGRRREVTPEFGGY
jgi:hypothetical protein